MSDYRQKVFVKNHIVRVELPKELDYKHVNVVISPIDNEKEFSFQKVDFKPIKIDCNQFNISTQIIMEERDLK